MKLIKWIFLMLIIFAYLGTLTPSGAAVYQWINPSDGSWTVPGSWTGEHVPNGPEDQAHINANTTEVTVTLSSIGDQTIQLSGLTVDTGDTLVLQSRQTIDFVENGMLGPVLANNGMINFNSNGVNHDWLQANGTVVSIIGSGTFFMGPGENNGLYQINGGSFIHGSDHTIKGSGSIYAPVVNLGTILADRGDEYAALIVKDEIDNAQGTIGAVDVSHIIRVDAIINGGRVNPGQGDIRMNGGTLSELILGPGLTTLVSRTLNWFKGNMTLDNTQVTIGLATLELIPLDGESESELVNNGGIDLTGSGVNHSSLTANGTGVTLRGTGQVSMAGNAHLKTLNGGSFINSGSHTIQGAGEIEAPVDNLGLIQARGGNLKILTSMDNSGGIIGVQDSIGQLHITTDVTGGWIDPGEGAVILIDADLINTSMGEGHMELTGSNRLRGNQLIDGTQLNAYRSTLFIYPDQSGYDPVITNHGTITVTPFFGGSELLIADCSPTFTGHGNIVLVQYGKILPLNTGSLVNDTLHTISGSGVLGVPVENRGLIRIENGILRVEQAVTGLGDLIIAPSGVLDLRTDLQTGNFFMARNASLILPGGAVPVEVNGHLTHSLVDETSWEAMSINPVYLTGGKGSVQYLEAAGQDLEEDEAGFTSNFQFNQLNIQGNSPHVILTDTVDNGNRTSNEALYVDAFQILPGAVLNLNGIAFYTRTDTGIKRVAPGTGTLYGGGEVLDVLIQPGDLEISDRDLAFEPTAVGSSSTPQILTLSNYGTTDVMVSLVTASGENFTMDDHCTGSVLASGESCFIDVTFAPTLEGQASGTLTIQSDDPVEPYMTVNMTGTGFVPLACRADLNGDFTVDESDLDIFSDEFGNPDCQGMCTGDIDLDGDTDGADLSILSTEFGREDCPQ